MEQARENTRQTRWTCSGWSAWHDRMPGSKATLHVTGSCEFPSSGYSVELKPHEPQGFIPAIYLLDLIVHEPTGPSSDVMSTEEVHYREETDKRYTHVQILPEDVLVEVKEVS